MISNISWYISSSYTGKTCCPFKARINEHIKKNNKSHVFKHLHYNTVCFDSHNSLSFKITDKATSKFDLKIKEALHIICKKRNLNPQQHQLAHFFHNNFVVTSLFFFIFVFDYLSSVVFMTSETNCWRLIPSFKHITTNPSDDYSI